MGVKKKLTELLDDIGATCDVPVKVDTDGCGTYRIEGGDYIADRLIANGVTFGEDNDVPTKWISVKDRLPNNNEHDWVLAQVVEDSGYMHIPKVMEYRQNRNDWFEETYGWLSEHNGAFIVTHWMPLPQPPKGE